jgi:hypothetical protein
MNLWKKFQKWYWKKKIDNMKENIRVDKLILENWEQIYEELSNDTT